jgi:hypothetical protein
MKSTDIYIVRTRYKERNTGLLEYRVEKDLRRAKAITMRPVSASEGGDRIRNKTLTARCQS